jgi:sugar lactone lactonase YvrE
MSPDGDLHVTAPTLGTYDPIYKIDRRGQVTTIASSLGRPQGLAFGPDGKLYVVDALAGSSGVYRIAREGAPELVLAGPGLIGIAFSAQGGIVVASNDTAYRLLRI